MNDWVKVLTVNYKYGDDNTWNHLITYEVNLMNGKWRYTPENREKYQFIRYNEVVLWIKEDKDVGDTDL